MTILLANGCSHTAGSEIEYTKQFESYINAWPRWLADSMGWGWVNIAEAANSNAQIKRTTIEWIIENIELTRRYQANDVVVMIMWSGIDRFEVWNSKLKQLKSYSGLSLSSDINSNFSLELTEYIKYRTIIDDHGVNEYKCLFDVYLTAKYLESLNIKYYFMNAFHSWVDPIGFNQPNRSSDLVEQYKCLYEAYGTRRDRHLGFLKFNEAFWHYMRDNKVPFSEYDPRNTHYGIEGHKFWKDCIKAWMARIDNV